MRYLRTERDALNACPSSLTQVRTPPHQHFIFRVAFLRVKLGAPRALGRRARAGGTAECPPKLRRAFIRVVVLVLTRPRSFRCGKRGLRLRLSDRFLSRGRNHRHPRDPHALELRDQLAQRQPGGRYAKHTSIVSLRRSRSPDMLSELIEYERGQGRSDSKTYMYPGQTRPAPARLYRENKHMTLAFAHADMRTTAGIASDIAANPTSFVEQLQRFLPGHFQSAYTLISSMSAKAPNSSKSSNSA